MRIHCIFAYSKGVNKYKVVSADFVGDANLHGSVTGRGSALLICAAAHNGLCGYLPHAIIDRAIGGRRPAGASNWKAAGVLASCDYAMLMNSRCRSGGRSCVDCTVLVVDCTVPVMVAAPLLLRLELALSAAAAAAARHSTILHCDYIRTLIKACATISNEPEYLY